MIDYTDSLDGIMPDMLEGFFRGWKTPHTPEAHLEIMRNSQHVVLALHPDRHSVVGFVTALTDGTQAAFIPLLEVLPDYQRRGIGTALMREGLSRLKGLNARGCCVVGHPEYYKRFGFRNIPGLVHEGVPQEVFLALPLDGHAPQGTVEFHEGFKADGRQEGAGEGE